LDIDLVELAGSFATLDLRWCQYFGGLQLSGICYDGGIDKYNSFFAWRLYLSEFIDRTHSPIYRLRVSLDRLSAYIIQLIIEIDAPHHYTTSHIINYYNLEFAVCSD
jgi:hypothetical protein